MWDSRGRPTVEAEVRLANGVIGRAIAPAGASRGSHEAIDLRDGGRLLGGLGVERAVQHVCAPIATHIQGMDACDQASIDVALITLDGTPNKGRLGGNAIIAVSMAVLHAAANAAGCRCGKYLAEGKTGPTAITENQIFGVEHMPIGAVDIQDFMIMAVGARSFDHALS